MASHVPFLAVRPDDQFSTETKTLARAASIRNGIPPAPSEDPIMEGAEGPYIPAPKVMAASKMPAYIRFPLMCILSLSLSTLFYSFIADWAGFEFASVARDLTETWQVAVVVGWKFVELSMAWYAGYDYVDILALSILSNTPYYYLLTAYYNIDWWAAAAALTIDVSAITIPFALLRPMNQAHVPTESSITRSLGRAVTRDPFVTGPVMLLGTAIYTITVYSSFYTWLPTYLIKYFDGIRTIRTSYIYNGQDYDVLGLLYIFLLLQPLGWASLQFLFMPALRAKNSLVDALKPLTEARAFDGETASFAQTLAYNMGFGEKGFSHRTEVLTKRTTVLALCTFVNTVVRVFGSIEGTEIVGSLGWASVWLVASVLVGTTFGLVGGE